MYAHAETLPATGGSSLVQRLNGEWPTSMQLSGDCAAHGRAHAAAYQLTASAGRPGGARCLAISFPG